jgi:rare lipoprotein A
VPKTGGGIYKIGTPYQVAGTWYYPKEEPGYDATGIASWYGTEFHGRLTANGEIFDRNAVTAAHPTLPMPSNVRVTNLETGKSITVRVNDRGPFKSGRIIDLSERAAELLGYQKAGTARVRVAYLGRAPLDGQGPVPPPHEDEFVTAVAAAPTAKIRTAGLPPVGGMSVAELRPSETGTLLRPTSTSLRIEEALGEVTDVPVPAATAIYIQAGAYSSLENANRVVQRLRGAGAQLSTVTREGRPFHRVRIGPFQDVDRADAALAEVIARGHQDAAIVVE